MAMIAAHLTCGRYLCLAVVVCGLKPCYVSGKQKAESYTCMSEVGDVEAQSL